METARLTALKLVNMSTLLVKETHTPVVFKLNLVEPLSNAQLNLLAVATPWKPSVIEAVVTQWNDEVQAFDASITTIETPPKTQTQKQSKTLRWGQVKRKRGFAFHD